MKRRPQRKRTYVCARCHAVIDPAIHDYHREDELPEGHITEHMVVGQPFGRRFHEECYAQALEHHEPVGYGTMFTYDDPRKWHHER